MGRRRKQRERQKAQNRMLELTELTRALIQMPTKHVHEANRSFKHHSTVTQVINQTDFGRQDKNSQDPGRIREYSRPQQSIGWPMLGCAVPSNGRTCGFGETRNLPMRLRGAKRLTNKMLSHLAGAVMMLSIFSAVIFG